MGEELKLIATIFSIGAAVLMPTVWFIRQQFIANRQNNKETTTAIKKTVESAIDTLEASTKENIKRLEQTSSEKHKELQTDFKELRDHFDDKMETMKMIVDTKTGKLAEELREEIREVNKKVEGNAHHTHSVEKRMLQHVIDLKDEINKS